MSRRKHFIDNCFIDVSSASIGHAKVRFSDDLFFIRVVVLIIHEKYLNNIFLYNIAEASMPTELMKIVHRIILESNVPAKDLAKRIGKPYSTLLREANPYDDGAKMGVETLLEIMKITGDFSPLTHMMKELTGNGLSENSYDEM